MASLSQYVADERGIYKDTENGKDMDRAEEERKREEEEGAKAQAAMLKKEFKKLKLAYKVGTMLAGSGAAPDGDDD